MQPLCLRPWSWSCPAKSRAFFSVSSNGRSVATYEVIGYEDKSGYSRYLQLHMNPPGCVFSLHVPLFLTNASGNEHLQGPPAPPSPPLRRLQRAYVPRGLRLHGALLVPGLVAVPGRGPQRCHGLSQRSGPLSFASAVGGFEGWVLVEIGENDPKPIPTKTHC